VEAEAKAAAADAEAAAAAADAYQQSEIVLNTPVVDMAKLDAKHAVVSVGPHLDVWTRPDRHGFFAGQASSVVRVWEEEADITLVVARPADSALLIASKRWRLLWGGEYGVKGGGGGVMPS
jgi:hypothetical protein